MKDSSIEHELRDIRDALESLSRRVEAIEAARVVHATAASATQVPAAVGAFEEDATARDAVITPVDGFRDAPLPEEQSEKDERLPSRVSFDWERVLGRNWFAIAGALALAIGIGFFLRLAFENEWVGTTERVLLGLLCGLALLGTGQWTHGKYPFWAQTVTGAGLSVLYLSAYAAFGFYQMIGPVAALAALAAIAALSGLLALRHESKPIALLGITGAFLTPVLLGRDLPSPALFLAYILLVDAGILGIATFRNWRWFTLIGMGGSYLLFALWLGDISGDDQLLAQLGLTAIFLVFVAATTLFHVLRKLEPGSSDLALMTLNAAAYYGMTFGLAWTQYQEWFGALSLGLAGLYGLVAYAAKRQGADEKVSLFAMALALVFLTVAVPLQFGGSWITVGWLAEGIVLVWLGSRGSGWRLRTAGLAALVIGTGHMLAFDTPAGVEGFRPVLNVQFLVFALAIAAWYGAAYFYRKGRPLLRDEERYNVLALTLVAHAVTLWLLSFEAAAFFESRGRAGEFGFTQAHHYAYFTLTVLWAGYASVLIVLGLTRRAPAMRLIGLGLLGVAVAKLAIFDITLLELDRYSLLLNARFLVFAWVIALCYGAAYVYYRLNARAGDSKQEWERYVVLGLVLTANLLTLMILSADAIAFFDSLQRAGAEQEKQLALTLLWAVYAVGLVGMGVFRDSVPVRLAGVGLLAVTVLKLFGFDVFLLDRGYRVAAFIGLGALLLGVALVYSRYNQAVKGFLLGGRP